jgi:hypothetical protein
MADMNIKQWFYDTFTEKGRIVQTDLDFGRSILFVVFYPNAGLHALVIELNHLFEPNIEMLNELSELGYMSVCCKTEEQVKQTIAAYLSYEE